jgi:L-arabinonolactonase
MSANVALPLELELGESLVWDSAEARLWWTDIHARQIGCATPGGGHDVQRFDTPARVGALALRGGGGLLLALEDAFVVRDEAASEVAPVAALDSAAPSTRLNDGRVDPFGNFVCGSMVEDGGTIGSARLYRLSPFGEVKVLLPSITCANATCWSPDGAWMYFSDMPTGRVDRRAYRPWGEPLGEPEPFAQLDPAEGLPDGAVTDEEGGLWLAVWGGGKVLRFDARGRRTHEVAVPTTNPTCPAFGGAGLDTLFVASARFGLTPAQQASEPEAGHIFACEPGLAGRPEGRFLG